MGASRTPYAYQRRKQFRALNWPGSTFAPAAALVHKYKIDKSTTELKSGEGAPPADRVKFNNWDAPGTENGVE
jgi:hypothetical protein